MEKLREEVNRTDCKKLENLKSIPRLVGNECFKMDVNNKLMNLVQNNSVLINGLSYHYHI